MSGGDYAVARPDASVLQVAERVGREVLSVAAASVDTGGEPPHASFQALAQAGLLALTVPREFGGHGADPLTVTHVVETLARFCGVTTFLLAQHLGECSRIAAARYPLAAEVLPRLAVGEYIAGVGASQLRRTGEPMLRAREVEGGYVLHGQVPWASGRGLMTHLSLGAVVDGAGPLFFWMPFVDAPGMDLGQPMDLVVMRASATVSIHCTDLFVPTASVVGDDRSGSWSVRHGGALSNPVAYLLGVGSACIDQLQARTQRAGSEAQVQYARALAQELDAARDRYYRLLRLLLADCEHTDLLDQMLACRVAISRQVLHLASVAVTAEGGTAHLLTNPAQRHLREAAFYCTVTVNAAAREALILGL